MHSLFSRARTASTPNKAHAVAAQQEIDELGRISSRASTAKTVQAIVKNGASGTPTSSKKARKAAQLAAELEEQQIPDGTFLALTLAPPPSRKALPPPPPTAAGSPTSAASRAKEPEREQDYGYLSYQRHVVLGLDEVDRLVRVLADELGQRGLTTPFIFSSLALDVSVQGVRRLINTFLKTCAPFPTADAERGWRDEVRFAGPAEVAMCLRWGLARVVRVYGGNAVRGLVAWEGYTEWAEREAQLNYPPTHFAAFLQPLEPLLRAIIFNILSICARLTAHSASSGHTPPTLSSLFGPLLFGIGPAALAFQHAYVHYLRSANAMEHLLLAFIRWQDAPSTQGSAKSLGVPARLKDWIRDYPAMLPERAKNKQDRLAPRPGARTIRVVSVRRNVRMYSPDLVKTASSWATRTPGGVTNAFSGSREWERVCPPTLKLPPRYADSYRKRMDLPSGFHPQVTITSTSSTHSTASSSTLVDDDYFGLGKEDERFRSLTDLKWGEFESMGFAGSTDLHEKKLQFDLTESARTDRAAKRQTLSWNDFSSSGFTRTDDPLNATLQFSPPLASSVKDWPEQQEEMRRKLRKAHRALPPFGWDTEPVMGQEEVIEEAFLDVFCDLVYGGGWMDIEREEDVDRECNWALVEYKSLPVSGRSTTSNAAHDPRTSSTVFLFEEFVPLEYRQSLSAGQTNKRRLPAFLFGTSSKAKPWKPAQTLNGRPYQVGLTPSSPTVREVEFDALLRANGSTTKISLNGRPRAGPPLPIDARPSGASTDSHTSQTTVETSDSRITGPLYIAPRDTPTPTGRDSPSTPTAAGKRSRFRLPTPGSGSRNSRIGLPPAEYEDVDFDVRLASLDALPTSGGGMSLGRRSKDDAWVDILVANHGRRMGGQDAEMRPGAKPAGARERENGNGGRRGRGGDPEVASQEVARALEELSMSRGGESDEESEPEPMSANPYRGHERERMDSTATDVTQLVDPYGGMVDPEEVMTPQPQPDAHFEPEPAPEFESRIPKKRVGSYFDLHPDRRANLPPRPPGSSRPNTADSALSDEIDYPPVTHAPRDDDVTSNAPTNASVMMPAGRVQLRKVPPPAEPAPKLATSTVAPGRTAALIEMFKQRDAAAVTPPVISPAVSPSNSGSGSPGGTNIRRLPRPPKEELPLPPRPAEKTTPTPSPPPPAPAPAPVVEDEIESVIGDGESEVILPEDLEPPRLVESVTPGRESPYRYVHGAPLHNVVEEEEEEQ